MNDRSPRSASGRWSYWLFGAAILYRIGLTAASMNYIEFKDDEFTWMMASYRNLHEQLALVAPPSSVGLMHPPFFVYLTSIPVAFTLDPVLVSSFIVLVNLAGIAALYVFVRRLFDRDVAVAVTALFCTAPWEIILARKIWPADTIFPLMAFFLLFFTAYLQTGSRWRLYAAFAMFALLLQPHQSAWFLIVPFAVYLVMCRVRVAPRDIAIGLAIACVFWASYFYYFAVVDPGALAALIRSHFNHAGAEHTPESFRLEWTFFITTGKGFDFLLGHAYPAFLADFPIVRLCEAIFGVYMVLAALAVVSYIATTAARIVRLWLGRRALDPQTKTIALLLAFAIGLHLTYLAIDMPVAPHYYAVIYPTLALLTVLLLANLGNWMPPARAWLTSALATIVAANLCFMTCFFLFISHHPTEIDGDYGVPYLAKRAHMKAMIRHEAADIRARASQPPPAR